MLGVILFVAIFAAYAKKDKLTELAVSALAGIIRAPAVFKRHSYKEMTRGVRANILGAISVAENARHPLDGENITAQCIAFYQTHEYPCAGDLSKWLSPPPRGVTIMHIRGGNILISVIDLTDRCTLTFDAGEYVFEPLAFDSVEIDDLAGISVYNCAQLSGALRDPSRHLTASEDAQNGVD